MKSAVSILMIACLCTSVSAHAMPALSPPSAPVAIGNLIPLVDWQKQLKITDGKDQGKLVPLTFHRGTGTSESWQLKFGDYADIHLRAEGNGGLVMERLDLVKSRSYIVYEPSLPIFARDISSGIAVLRQANFKMYDRETGRLKRIGRATHMIKRISRSAFETPAGVIEGYFIEIEHHMNMAYAQLQISLGLGCRLDEGPVYGAGRYTLTKLGLFTETKTAVAGLAIR